MLLLKTVSLSQIDLFRGRVLESLHCCTPSSSCCRDDSCSWLSCVSFSLQWLLSVQGPRSGSLASGVAACELSSCGSQALECGVSSCDAQAQQFCSMWSLPGPGIELVSLALQGRFLTPEPPRKPKTLFFFFPFFKSIE